MNTFQPEFGIQMSICVLTGTSLRESGKTAECSVRTIELSILHSIINVNV